ncbi:MAG: hypothetical protein ACJ74O_00585 [Frankiaceae bacterium]
MKRRPILVVTACAVAAMGVATPAWAYWSVGSSNATGSASASVLGTPTISTSGVIATDVTINVTAAPASGLTPTGYRVARTAPGATVATVCTITGTTGSCHDTAPAVGQTNAYSVYARYTTGGANWESFDPATTSVAVPGTDTTPPTNALSLTAASGGGSYLTGSGAAYSLYYRGSVAGSVKLVDAVADTGSGPASAGFPALAAAGWTHAAETVSTPAGGPYVSTALSWTAAPANPAAYVVTGADLAGNAAGATVTFASDTTAPAGGSISYADGYYRTASVPVTVATGTDGGSGVNAASVTVQRATASLTTGTCGAFGGFATVTLSGGADTSVASGTCYQYRALVSDNVGNQTTYVSANVAKVDAIAPTVTSLALADGNGGATAGHADNNDTVTVTFSETLDGSKLCSTWPATGAQVINANNAVTVTITDAGANDALTVSSSTCTVSVGTISLGADYVSATTTYGGSGGNKSTISWDGAGTLTIMVGQPSALGNLRTGVVAGTPSYAPAAALTDLAGNPISTAPFTAAAASRF